MTALLTATSILGDDGRPTYEEAMRHSSLSIMRCSAVGSRRSLSLHDGTLAPSVLRLRHRHHHACLRNQVTGITVSPSGLIAATHSEPHGHAASVTRVWDFRGKAAKLVSAEIDDCSLVTYSSTGRFNASIERAAGTKRIKLRDGESKNWKASLDGVGKPAAFGAEGRMFAATDYQGVVVVYGALGGSGNTLPTKKVAAVVNHGDTTHVQFLPNGRDIVTLSRDGTVRVSEARTGRTLRRMEVDGMAVAGGRGACALGVSPDGKVVVSVWSKVVYIWKHEAGRMSTWELNSVRSNEGWPLAISPDCRLLACRTEDGMDVSDVYSGQVLAEVRSAPGIEGMITAAGFSADGRMMAVGRYCGVVDIWDTAPYDD